MVSLAVSEDGFFALTTNNEARIHLWDLNQNKRVKTYAGKSKKGNLTAFSGDSKYFIAESSSGKIIIWDKYTYKPYKVISSEMNGAVSVQMTKENKVLGVMSDGTAILCDSEGKKIISRKISSGILKSEIAQKSGNVYVLESKKVLLLNALNIQKEEEWALPEKSLDLAVSAKGDLYVLGASGLVYHLEDEKLIPTTVQIKKASKIFLSPNSEVVGVASGSKISFYDIQKEKQVGEVSTDKDVVGFKTAIQTSSLFAYDENAEIYEFDLSLLGVEPLKEEQVLASNTTMRGLTLLDEEPQNASLKFGKYYALIIGIDGYTGSWTSLNNAVNDAKAVANLLGTKYMFDEIRTLYDGQATRENVIKELEYLVNNVKEGDNVFIYYSGHGDFKKNLNKGYWVPIDAHSMSTFQYISNSDLQTYIGGIQSRHTLLVSDACFSGDIFRGGEAEQDKSNSEKYLTKVHNLKSRRAITSGGIEPVMDGGKDGHSVFAYYLLQTLKNNQRQYLDADLLFESLKIPVVNNSEQVPNYNPIRSTGDEGGQFLFIKK